ncbi:MAG: hypothetical protein JXR30_03795 [Alphaproteobacteria bacterium]|nr:hypothetical protein [Alphaproteobacteria bacterium]
MRKKRVITLLLCVVSTPLFAWIGEKPTLSFPEVHASTFYPKRIQSQSRQASEYFLSVEAAPVKSVRHRELSEIAPPTPIEDVAAATIPEIKPDAVDEAVLAPKKPKLTYDAEGRVDVSEASVDIDDVDVKQEFHRTYVAQNKYLSMMEDPDGLAADESEDPFPEEVLPDEDLPPLEGVEEAPEDDFTFDFMDEDIKDDFKTAPKKEVASGKSLSEEVDAFEVESEPVSQEDKADSIQILQMKVAFDKKTTALSGKNVHLISSFAQVALNNPTNAIEISISKEALSHPKQKKRAAERLAIVSRILKDHGFTEDRIRPVLTARDEDSFVLRITNKDAYTGYQVQGDDFSDLIRTRTVSVQPW